MMNYYHHQKKWFESYSGSFTTGLGFSNGFNSLQIFPLYVLTTTWSLNKNISPVSKNTGTLEYVRGSHKWGLQPPKGKFHSPDDYKKELKNFAKKINKKIEIVYVEVPAGGVAFHHGRTWHGSGINETLSHRRAIVSHCVPHDAKFHPTNIGGTAKIYKKYKKNDSNELDEKYFPLLWKES